MDEAQRYLDRARALAPPSDDNAANLAALEALIHVLRAGTVDGSASADLEKLGRWRSNCVRVALDHAALPRHLCS